MNFTCSIILDPVFYLEAHRILTFSLMLNSLMKENKEKGNCSVSEIKSLKNG